MSKGSIASKKAMRDELWRRGELSFLCHPVQKEMRDIYYGSKNHSILVWLLSRQTGKCLEENTLVATPTGPVKIKDLVPGDIVYGFNRDGSVSETEVLAVEAQGKKEVINLFDNANGGIVAKATKEHRWLTINKNTRQYQELSTGDILKSKEHAIISIPQIELPDNQKLITVVETSREEVETYDIQVNNDTNLYLLANGLVTHNSSLLTILALEAAYREKNSIIKIITDTKVHAKTIFIPIFNQFLETCPDEIKPKYMAAEYCYVFENGSRIELAGSDGQHYEKLRGQRCLEKDTLILTPTGPVAIQNLKKGDTVYGYNKDGTVSETKVTNVYNNGIKEVQSLYSKGLKLLSATNNHRFLTNSQSSVFVHRSKKSHKEKTVSDIHESNSRIVREFVDIPCGTVHEPHAYAIGAMIGDGCRDDRKTGQLVLASIDEQIPRKVASILGISFSKDLGKNHRWYLKSPNRKFGEKSDFKLNHEHWIRNKYSYQKSFDYDVVDTWDRSSCLALIAGILDTDGSVYCQEKHNTLEIRFTTTSKQLTIDLEKLIYKLFQVKTRLKTRKWDKKSKHQAYDIKIRSGLHVKRILKELSPYLTLEYKKYQPRYDFIHSKEQNNYVKIEKREKYLAETFDIEVDNDTHLYLTADGLVTHNSSAVFIDEAGFCSELDVMVNSVLLPTTTHTGGKLVLSSTPPKEFTHPFLNFMERAELEGLLTKKTIDDNPLLTKEQISIIEKQMGGRNSEQFRREYLCHVIKLSTDSALPEVTDELLKNIVKEWQRPPFKDNYMAMDLGFNDLTAVLFGYYDFAKDKIIIEDELPFDYKIKNNTTKVLTSKIQEKEQEIWTNPHTNEISYPVSRVSDINHIVTKDIFENSNKTLYFTAPKKEEKTAMVSSLRILLASEKIIIHPRCENLIRHLKNVKWAKNGKEFARSVDNSHYDFVDALIYLVRSINFKKNPYPLGYGLNLREDNAHIPVNNSTYRGGNVDAFKAIMGMRKR